MKLELSPPPKGLRSEAAGGIAVVLAVVGVNYMERDKGGATVYWQDEEKGGAARA